MKKTYITRGINSRCERLTQDSEMDTCLDGQDTFIRLLDMLEIKY